MEEKAKYYITPAQRLELIEGGLVRVHVPDNKNIDACLGRIAKISNTTVEVWVRNVEPMAMHLYTLKHQLVEPMPLETEPDLVRVCDRINALKEVGLHPFEVEILKLLERPVFFTAVELEYLAIIERRYEVERSPV